LLGGAPGVSAADATIGSAAAKWINNPNFRIGVECANSFPHGQPISRCEIECR